MPFSIPFIKLGMLIHDLKIVKSCLYVLVVNCFLLLNKVQWPFTTWFKTVRSLLHPEWQLPHQIVNGYNALGRLPTILWPPVFQWLDQLGVFYWRQETVGSCFYNLICVCLLTDEWWLFVLKLIIEWALIFLTVSVFDVLVGLVVALIFLTC